MSFFLLCENKDFCFLFELLPPAPAPPELPLSPLSSLVRLFTAEAAGARFCCSNCLIISSRSSSPGRGLRSCDILDIFLRITHLFLEKANYIIITEARVTGHGALGNHGNKV